MRSMICWQRSGWARSTVGTPSWVGRHQLLRRCLGIGCTRHEAVTDTTTSTMERAVIPRRRSRRRRRMDGDLGRDVGAHRAGPRRRALLDERRDAFPGVGERDHLREQPVLDRLDSRRRTCPSPSQSSRLATATDTGAVLAAMSAASASAAGSTSAAGSAFVTSPSSAASAPRNVRPDSSSSAATANPATRGTMACERQLGQRAAADEGEGELGVVGHVAHVAQHRVGQADADGVAVDRGDDGLAHLVRPALAQLRGVTAAEPAARQVGTGAERPTGPGHHDGPHRVVAVGRRHRLAELDAEPRWSMR